MNALVDTPVLIAYLSGEARAAHVLDMLKQRAITVTTWLEVLAAAPSACAEETRAFLRTFERLSINESIADDALRLVQQHPQVGLDSALRWAAAKANRLVFLVAGSDGFPADDPQIVVALH